MTSAEGLKNIAKLVNEQWNLGINITLTSDIDLSGIDWTPIGIDYNHQYTGTFDGGDHTITGLTVTTSDQYAGLFGCIDSGGKVKNVTLEDVKIESDNDMSDVGGVAGWSYGNIENCSVSGSVSCSGSHSIAGGVVGDQTGGSITGCSSSAAVKGAVRVGGVAGLIYSGATLTACYATGSVTLESSGTDTYTVGGVVGYTMESTLTACYATGSVSGSGSGTIYAGGVAGANDGTITACYWSGSPDKGIGSGSGGVTQVDGTNVTWDDAIVGMNGALNGTGWEYELIDGNSLPTLK